LLRLLRSAADIQKKNGDSHMAVDHLILASADDRDISNIYKEAGVDKGRLEAAVKEVRTDQISLFFMKNPKISC
jgi:ATP-dependent Clp protease ATP-binding subunit ClpB